MATSWIFIGLKVKKILIVSRVNWNTMARLIFKMMRWMEHLQQIQLTLTVLKVSYQKYVTGSTQDLLILIARKMSRR